MLTNEQKKEIIMRLASRVEKMKCPICQMEKFTLLDGYITDVVKDDFRKISLGQVTMIPSVALVCNNCGFISQHSLGVLGILHPMEEKTLTKTDSETEKR